MVAVVLNLKPAKMREVMSYGMVSIEPLKRGSLLSYSELEGKDKGAAKAGDDDEVGHI